MNKSSQGGFTLIELVVVIVILGILAAFAVPRFMGMEGEARAATVKNMGGNLRAAAVMARSKCMAQGCGAAGFVTFENNLRVDMVNGYPSAATVANTLQSVQGFTPLVAGNTYTLTKIGGTANCWVRYTEAANVNTPPVISFQPGVPNGNNDNTIARGLANAC